MIEARIRKALPGASSLDLEFSVSEGLTVLYGPNGAGKTLTLDAIAGFVKPDEGRILLDDQIVFDSGSGIDVPARARRCGYLPPADALFPHMTLRENLVFSAACRRLPRLERHRKVSEIIERFHLSEAAGRRPGEASESERLRGSVARALVGQPRVLLADDPARGLDLALRAEAGRLLRQVQAEFGIPVLLATQDLDWCFDLAEEMLVLRGGRLLQKAAPREIFDQPAGVEVARLLGIYNLLPAEIKALDPARNVSRLRLEQMELTGPYFPGHLRGDQVTVCMRPEEVRARPADGKPGPNQLAVQLIRAAERPSAVRLEFTGGILADVPRSEYEQRKHIREWVVEFPADHLRVV
jgi:molybdate transport system ATP-binding protein